jgi:hypothetical protein
MLLEGGESSRVYITHFYRKLLEPWAAASLDGGRGIRQLELLIHGWWLKSRWKPLEAKPTADNPGNRIWRMGVLR